MGEADKKVGSRDHWFPSKSASLIERFGHYHRLHTRILCFARVIWATEKNAGGDPEGRADQAAFEAITVVVVIPVKAGTQGLGILSMSFPLLCLAPFNAFWPFF